MANPEHVKWLREGVTAWNSRRTYQSFVPDLRGQDIASMLRAAQMVTQDGKPNLRGVNLSQALLDGCDFLDTILDSANLSGAHLENSQLFFTNLTQARLNDADLTGANLFGARLGQANLTNCTLIATQLADADLVGTNLTGSRPWQASMISIFSRPQWSYPHARLDEEVTSINDVLRNISRIKSNYGSYNHQETTVFYFRGESKDTWKLTPSVMRRSGADGNSLRGSEGEMLVDLLSRSAEDFIEANSALDQMVVAQHYGLPTRLLDITRNPLASMFNASEKSPDSDGKVHIFAVPRYLVKPFSSDTVSVITNFARLRRNEQNLLLG